MDQVRHEYYVFSRDYNLELECYDLVRKGLDDIEAHGLANKQLLDLATLSAKLDTFLATRSDEVQKVPRTLLRTISKYIYPNDTTIKEPEVARGRRQRLAPNHLSGEGNDHALGVISKLPLV